MPVSHSLFFSLFFFPRFSPPFIVFSLVNKHKVIKLTPSKQLDIQIPTPQLAQVGPEDEVDDGQRSRMTHNTGGQGSQHKSLEGQGPSGGTR